jgi:hypothetical protein
MPSISARSEAHLPTLEEHRDPFELVDSPWGVIEQWRASTLATGTMGALQSVYDLVRSDSAALAARADATEARNALIEHLCAKVDAFETKLDNLVAQVAAEREARRADEARKATFDEEPLALPPGDPPGASGPSASATEKRTTEDNAPTHTPSGDLHSVAAKEEPPEETDNMGDLPEEIQLPKPLSEPEPEPKGSVQPQPISISLNQE